MLKSVELWNYALTKHVRFRNSSSEKCDITNFEKFPFPTVKETVDNALAGFTYEGLQRALWEGAPIEEYHVISVPPKRDTHYGPHFIYYRQEGTAAPLAIKYVKRQLSNTPAKTRWEVHVM